VLTKVTAYSQWANVDPLVFNIINRPDTDLFEMRNIDGLGAVKADINTTPMGSIDGSFYSGSSVGERNIVLTVGLDPDWQDWTMSRLRRLLAKYFIPKMSIRLVFETMEYAPMEISGYVESNEPDIWSKDPQHVISIICPSLYFKSVLPVNLTGQTDQDPRPIEYEGNVETGIAQASIAKISGTDPTTATFLVQDPDDTYISVTPTDAPPVDSTHNVVMSSLPGAKFIKRVNPFTAVEKNILNYASIQPRWPVIGPGTEFLHIFTDHGIQSWAVLYYPLWSEL
jgi:hypothetical protein